ncbi:NRAMP family divalent metal transporter [Kordiimonas sp.]|uniref:NRAMP family divalent metal transporter n=1 Tax=Kordiimonas sp. TaxID=1970157 RepID=UPI003A906AA2
MQTSSKGWLRQLGPGLLFAGMAIGTSHLVQSTRAGAVFGLGLAGVILMANIAKYPAFRFGAQYAAATGETLIAGYRRVGLVPLLFLMAVFEFAHGFAVAAISLVTAGMLKAVLGVSLPLMPTIAVVLLGCTLFLGLGRYRVLERVNRVFMGLLTVATLTATVLALPSVDWSFYPDTAPAFDLTAFLFVVALAGWMPSPIEASVFSSLWTLAKKQTGDSVAPVGDDARKAAVHDAVADFNVGYVGTTILAICFMLLGAGVMHSSGVIPEDTAPGFAAQLVALYSGTLGAWSAPVVGFAALTVMFTTAITVLDGLTRALVVSWATLRNVPEANTQAGTGRAYIYVLIGLGVAAMLLIGFFMQGFRAFIDLVTSIAFLTAPVFAFLNHRVMMQDTVPEMARPKGGIRLWSYGSITTLALFALAYLWLLAR